MIYIDTNIIVSYMDEADANHSRAVKLIQSLRGEKLVTSRLALVELASVYSRAGLEDPLALALYSIEESGVELAEIDFNDALSQAFRLSAELRLRTLDLLHIMASKLLGARYFATFDKDIINKKDLVARIGIRVISDKPTLGNSDNYD